MNAIQGKIICKNSFALKTHFRSLRTTLNLTRWIALHKLKLQIITVFLPNLKVRHFGKTVTPVEKLIGALAFSHNAVAASR